MEQKLTRTEFERMTEDLVERCKVPFQQAIADWGKPAEQIDHVILVGGSTRMPMIQELVKTLTGGKEPHKGVNPDEVVAVGAAVQGGVLGGEVQDVVLLDVTPLSLGVETLGGVMTVMISRNTTIPTQKKEIYSTATDNQTSVEIHVLQGERAQARDNRTLGKFHLEGLPSAPRGMPKVEVTFDIDANGILSVQAKDMATGKDQKITITASSGLNKDDIERMVKDAAAHEAEDKRRRDEIERRNKLDNLCYQLEKQLAENKEKLGDFDVSTIESLIKEGRAAVEQQDDAKVQEVSTKLEQEAHKLAAKLYESAGAPGEKPPGGGEGDATPADGDDAKKKGVIDAEFEESN